MEHSAHGVTFEPLRSNHLAENVYYYVEAVKSKDNLRKYMCLYKKHFSMMISYLRRLVRPLLLRLWLLVV